MAERLARLLRIAGKFAEMVNELLCRIQGMGLSGQGERQQLTTTIPQKPMNNIISRTISLSAITGLLAMAGISVQAQTTDPLLTSSIDQAAFPQITVQPVDQTVPVGATVTLSVQANNADS
jgi:hypothetical protein